MLNAHYFAQDENGQKTFEMPGAKPITTPIGQDR
jgi:hypothetical protein